MLIDTDYRFLGTVPEDIRRGLTELANNIDWHKDDFNRTDPLSTRIVRVPYGVRAEEPQEQTHDVLNILEQFAPIDKWMHEKFPDHVFVKCEIACLLPGQDVIWHIDMCWWHQYSHRIHIPIVSNPDCFFCIEDREHYLKVGEYYEVNNRRYHSYCNRGDSFRLHLIFDVLDRKIYQESQEQNIDISSVSRPTLGLTRQQFFEKLPDLLKEEYY